MKTRIGRSVGYPEAANIYRRMVSAIIRNISPIFDDGLRSVGTMTHYQKAMKVEKWIKNELGTLNVTNFNNQSFLSSNRG